MADLSLPPEEHGGDDGKVTSAVHTIRKDSYGVGGWCGACILKIARPRRSAPYPWVNYKWSNLYHPENLFEVLNEVHETCSVVTCP